MAFIVGASGFDGEKRFTKQKKIIKHLLTSYNTTAGQAHVGVITNSRPVKTAIAFGVYHGSRLIEEIDRVQNTRKESLIDALRFANDDMFTMRNGARPSVKKSLVVFVNDQVESDSNALELVGKRLRQSGINVIIISMDPSVENDDNIRSLSPSNYVFFFPPSLDELSMVLFPVVRATYPGTSSFIYVNEILRYFLQRSSAPEPILILIMPCIAIKNSNHLNPRCDITVLLIFT